MIYNQSQCKVRAKFRMTSIHSSTNFSRVAEKETDFVQRMYSTSQQITTPSYSAHYIAKERECVCKTVPIPFSVISDQVYGLIKCFDLLPRIINSVLFHVCCLELCIACMYVRMIGLVPLRSPLLKDKGRDATHQRRIKHTATHGSPVLKPPTQRPTCSPWFIVMIMTQVCDCFHAEADRL